MFAESAKRERELAEDRIRRTTEFKALGTSSFRSAAAREVRDRELCTGVVNFCVQAFRYRGKANYRDSIYLSYGPSREAEIRELLCDLAVVGCSFNRMAMNYVSQRVESCSWNSFVTDIDNNSLFSLT